MVKRKKPVRHKVRGHTREGKLVKSFVRGSGTARKNPSKVVGTTPQEISKKRKIIRSRHHLTKLTGWPDRIDKTELIIAHTDQMESHVRDALIKSHKAGYILYEDYDKNMDAIHRWEITRERVSDIRREIRELEKGTKGMKEQIASVESGKWKMLVPMLPTYRERLKKNLNSLSTKRRQLKGMMSEYKPLNKTIKLLKDEFMLYITSWRNE